MTKTCIKCGHTLDIEEFSIRKDAADGHRNECKQCKKAIDKQYYLNNKDHAKQASKLWREHNPEKSAAIYARYRKTDKRRAVSRKWAKNNTQQIQEKRVIRYHTDPEYNTAVKIRRRIYMAISKQRVSKGSSSGELLGCTYAELYKHLSEKLRDGMTFVDIESGKIHLDHIKPCCQFNLLDPIQQYVCFNYRNLQPLYAFDNLQKSGTWTEQDETNWQSTIWPKIREDLLARGIIDSSYEGC